MTFFGVLMHLMQSIVRFADAVALFKFTFYLSICLITCCDMLSSGVRF